ncbi:MAG TPA: hypothetical protein DEP51_00425 [Clostridiales bacterium]|nr:hypothetical protein [Clostridiales bacterium]
MEVVRCSRCGAFYTNGGYVCPKCSDKDNFELATFKNFVEENGVNVNSLNQVSISTGISEKNLNRFLGYEGLEGYKKLFK